MWRTGKPFHGCANLFVLFPLIFYIASTTFVLDVDGAHASPSQREIKEAQQIVGRFLRDEAGSKWLSSLAKTKTAPLTTEDLMNAILQATRPGGKVWHAASILNDAVKAQTVDGSRPDSFMGQSENWKDLIADIEKEDDIICLYRKNTEETAKKAEDWQKFLKTVSPGYTVHLAIDTGLKYVICLKKIDVPEETSTELSIARGTFSTAASPSLLLHEVTTVTPAIYPITPGKITPITSSVMKIYSNNAKPFSESEESSDESCADQGTEDDRSEDIGDEGNFFHEDVVDDKVENGSDSSYVNEYSEENQKPGMQDDLSAELPLHNYPLNTGTRWQRPIPYPIAQNNNHFNNYGWPSYPPFSRPGRFLPQSSIADPECNRPIIFLIPSRNVPFGYQPRPPLWFPVQRSFEPPQLSSTPRIPTFLPEKLGPSFNPVESANNFQRGRNNLGKPLNSFSTTLYKGANNQPIISRNTPFTYTIPRGKMTVSMTAKKPVIQTTRNALGFNVFNPATQDLNIHKSAMSIDKPSLRPQWQQKPPTRYIFHPRFKFPNQFRFVRNNFLHRLEQERRDMLRRLILNVLKQRLQSRLSNFKPLSAPIIVSRPMQQSIFQYPQPSIYSKFPIRDFSNSIKCAFPAQISLLRTQKLDCFNYQLIDHLRSVQRQLQMLQQMQLRTLQRQQIIQDLSIAPIMRSPVVNLPCFNGADLPAKNLLVGHRTGACLSLCDKPIKLQISIQGKVQEPLKVSVITDPGQRVEIVRSGNPIIMPYGSRAETSGSLVRAEPKESNEETEPVVAEVEKRMNYRDDETEEHEEEETSTTECTSIQSEELTMENNSSSTSEKKATETTDNDGIEISSDEEIGKRIFTEKTTGSSMETNTTISTITNSTFFA